MNQQAEILPGSRLTNVVTKLAISWALWCMPGLFNILMLTFNATDYHPVSFKVTGAVYDEAVNPAQSTYWLTGTVDGSEERLVFPPLQKSPVKRVKRCCGINNSADLLERFPAGTQLPALYNPAMRDVIFAHESLRLRYDNGKFWEDLADRRSAVLTFVLIPFVPVLALHLWLHLYKQLSV